MRSVFAFLLLCFFSASGHAAELAPRQRVPFNSGWRFQEGDAEKTSDLKYDTIKPWLLAIAKRSALPKNPQPTAFLQAAFAQPDFDDSAWRKITLPHDWAVEKGFDQNLPGETGKLPFSGVGWYRKSFKLPATEKGKRVVLAIDGAMSYSLVWVNGKFAGGWPYGYTSFEVDLTPYIKYSGENVVAVRLDNPPESSRWYPGGGIYRNVWLETTPQVYVVQWGVQIATPEVSEKSATVAATVAVRNDSDTDKQLNVRADIYPIGSRGERPEKPAASVTTELSPMKPGVAGAAQISTSIADPRLWSLESPNRYLLVATVLDGDKIVDRKETAFGIRSAKFDAREGFLLNGKHVPIRGVCMHHDLGYLGTAFNTRAAERQIQILKDMGCNAIRTSHNPPAPELLDLCDKMGMLVLDEAFDCWRQSKKENDYSKLFDDWHRLDLLALVRRDRNHPSVIAWSIGNELVELGDAKLAIPLAKQLAEIVRKADPSRPVTLGSNSLEAGFYGLPQELDLFGYNYKPYAYREFLDKNPGVVLFGSETASTISSRGEYVFPLPASKEPSHPGATQDYQVTSYDLIAPPYAQVADDEFKAQTENPAVPGEFVWTGFDYLGEPVPFSDDTTSLLNYNDPAQLEAARKQLADLGKVLVPSRSSYFGIIDLAGFPKDRYYLYQANWRPDLPMAHILPHWNWPERKDQVTPVMVYTSGDSAELFLNGWSQGLKKKEPGTFRLRWDNVKYAPGELKVVAYKGRKKWAEDIVQTTGPAVKLVMQADRTDIENDALDLSFVTLRAVDKDGRTVPNAKLPVKLSIDGPGEIAGAGNGDPTDHANFRSTDQKIFNGLALVIVRAEDRKKGKITLRAASPGLEPAEIVFTTK
jgi:beta-galactosidase